MSNQLFSDVAAIKIAVAVNQKTLESIDKRLDRHMTSHRIWTIATLTCVVSSAVAVAIAVIT